MMKSAFLMSWQFLLSISAVFFVTFTIFPAVICDTKIEFLQGINNGGLRTGWTMLVFIFCFNFFDTVGRWLGGQPFGMLKDRPVLLITYARVVFIITAYLVDQNIGPAWLIGDSGDWFKLLNMALFAFTNGYCST
jgi:Nucleoside transporter